jgi:hypothetical protein
MHLTVYMILHYLNLKKKHANIDFVCVYIYICTNFKSLSRGEIVEMKNNLLSLKMMLHFTHPLLCP